MKLKDIKSAHFIGIGGAGMAGVAELFFKNGIKVSGSDLVPSSNIKRLSSIGIKIFFNQIDSNIHSNLSVVVIAGRAIKKNNPELKSALSKKIKVIERSDALAMLTDGKKLIAVTGSHGKTTVASIIAQSLLDSGVDISFVIGAELMKYNSGAHFGTSDIFVIEADESDASFLKYKPYISVISNIEPDHLDFYKNIQNYNNTFKKYISLTQNKLIIISLYKEFVPVDPPFEVEYFASQDNYFATNKVAAMCVLKKFGISKISFNGTKRRFQFKGSVNNISVYDDYAHHPTEINSLILIA
jgi:UDP-N-acetylmuramate--alanine ligase